MFIFNNPNNKKLCVKNSTLSHFSSIFLAINIQWSVFEQFNFLIANLLLYIHPTHFNYEKEKKTYTKW